MFMTAKIIDGKKMAAEIEEEVRKNLEKAGVKPFLVFFVVGDDPATQIYVREKTRACDRVGILSEVIHLSHDATERQITEKIKIANSSSATGIIVQLPLPPHINEVKVISTISPQKDVDCMHPENIGKLFYSSDLIPCTVAGILELISAAEKDISGKKIAVINRRHIGKSLSVILANMKASVSLCGKNTQLPAYTKDADIIITAAGSAGLLKREMIKPGAIVIDVGISRKEGKVFGDAEEGIREIASFITLVPGGVGPTTVAMLMKNTAEMAIKNLK